MRQNLSLSIRIGKNLAGAGFPCLASGCYGERVEATQSVLVDDVAGEVRAWMARRQRSGANVARELGWTEVYLSRRLLGRVPFDVADLEALAVLLEVPASVFFEVPGGLRRAPISARSGLGLAA